MFFFSFFVFRFSLFVFVVLRSDTRSCVRRGVRKREKGNGQAKKEREWQGREEKRTRQMDGKGSEEGTVAGSQ